MKFFNFGSSEKPKAPIPPDRIDMATKGTVGKIVSESFAKTPEQTEVEDTEVLYRNIDDQSFKALINYHVHGVLAGQGQHDAVSRAKLEGLAAERGLSVATLDRIIAWLVDKPEMIEEVS